MNDIEPGSSWACKFQVATLVNENNIAVEENGKPGVYEGLGIIKTRDCENRLVELVDTETERVFVVPWDDCRDIDEVEWRDPD